MIERKILFFILSVIAYCMYSVHMWFMKDIGNINTEISLTSNEAQPEIIPKNEIEVIKQNVKPKVIPLIMKDACSVLQIFNEKPTINKHNERKIEDMDSSNNALTMIGITVFLVILVLNAVLDVLKVKEEEKARRKLNPDGERRQSLAEFANKKPLRRESSKFSLQLFQIAESFVNNDEEKESRRQTRPYLRGDSTNSYLSDRKTQSEHSAPASISETTTAEPSKLVKRQSVAKLFGARPVPMVRRSSFPVLPLNPEVQALMLGHRQSSFDSDDESDGKGRRVRIIRRY